MKNFLLIILLLFFSGCRSVQYIPVKGEERLVYKDSIIERVDTQYIKLTESTSADLTGYLDTLHLKNKYAEAVAWNDTLRGVLRGYIATLDAPVEVYTKEKERIVYRDSVSVQEVPVEVERIEYKTPAWVWWVMFAELLIIISLALVVKYTHQKPR